MKEEALNAVVDTEEAWLSARLSLDDVARRIAGIDTAWMSGTSRPWDFLTCCSPFGGNLGAGGERARN